MIARGHTHLKLVQISDCHVSSDPETAYRGLNAGRSLKSLLPAIRLFQPDLVLLTGDVSEDASPASYRRVAALLGTIGAPVLALPGNHDDPQVMRHHFPEGPWNGPLFRAAKGWQLVLLDSTARNEISGVLSEACLARLESGLSRCVSDHVLLALHHQPLEVGSPWIDKYALREPAPFLQLLDKDDRIRCVAWGHVHQEFCSERGKVKFLGAPSSVANSIPGRERFTLDVGGPACRWLVLDRDGGVGTGLLRA